MDTGIAAINSSIMMHGWIHYETASRTGPVAAAPGCTAVRIQLSAISKVIRNPTLLCDYVL